MFFKVFSLLVIYQIKHLICDYFLQNAYMAFGKEKEGKDWIIPLTAHAGIHALGTLVIFCIFDPSSAWLSLVDFVIHFLIDRAKGSSKFCPNIKKSLGPHIVLAIDQMLHHLTHYIFVYALIS